MDFGALIKAPMQDEEWIKKCILIGLMTLIPVAGLFNLLGFLKACYLARKAGETNLPEANLSYMGDGWWLFVAMLPAVGAIVAVEIVFVLLTIGASYVHHNVAFIIGTVGNLTLLLVALAFWVAMPAIFYIHLAKGERWAGAKFGEIKALIMSDFNSYLMFWVAFLIAGFIGGVGQVACGIGVIVTLPFGYAIQGFAVADFEKKAAGGASPG